MNKKSTITTHVLDVSTGKPAEEMIYSLELKANDDWTSISFGVTNADGRVDELCPPNIQAGIYRITFGTSDYFKAKGVKCFYPSVSITFEITNPSEHYHVPLLLSPFGFSTYRGS